MKKILIIVLIIAIPSLLGFIGYYYFQKNRFPTVDTSYLQSVNVNGVNYKTTGAIPNSDEISQKRLNEIVLLGSKGTITSEGYLISVEGQGDVVIKLSAPFEKNKKDATDWLKNNGFGDIPQSSITFQEI